MTLSEFLLSRIAEDEEIAQQWPDDRPSPPNGDALWIDALGHPIYQPRGRVLAECEAKRGLLRHLWVVGVGSHDHLDHCDRCQVIRYFGEVYASHPDYRDEWRP